MVMPTMEMDYMESESERFSELMGEKETRGALAFLFGLDKKDLLVYTQIIKEMHRLMFMMINDNGGGNDNGDGEVFYHCAGIN